MKVKIELEIEVETVWHEIDGCTPENFNEHVKFILNHHYNGQMMSDIDFIQKVIKITFPTE